MDHAPERSTDPSPSTRTLSAVAAVLLVLTAVLPSAVAGLIGRSTGVTIAGLPATVSDGLDRWLASGAAEPDAVFSSAVRFWATFHGAKALASAGLLVSLVLLLSRLWAAYGIARTRGRRIALSVTGIGVTLLSAVTILVVIANVQGTLAPLSSVLSFLPGSAPTPAMTSVHDQLAAGATTPMLSTLIGDFRTFHAAVVGCAVLALVGLASAARFIWIRWARIPAPRRRRVVVVAELPVIAMAMFIGLVLLANLSTVADTPSALAAFFGAGA